MIEKSAFCENIVVFLDGLTTREYEVLCYSSINSNCFDISEQMGITVGAVYKLRKSILEQAADAGLKVGTRQEAYRRLVKSVSPYLCPDKISPNSTQNLGVQQEVNQLIFVVLIKQS